MPTVLTTLAQVLTDALTSLYPNYRLWPFPFIFTSAIVHPSLCFVPLSHCQSLSDFHLKITPQSQSNRFLSQCRLRPFTLSFFQSVSNFDINFVNLSTDSLIAALLHSQILMLDSTPSTQVVLISFTRANYLCTDSTIMITYILWPYSAFPCNCLYFLKLITSYLATSLYHRRRCSSSDPTSKKQLCLSLTLSPIA